MTLDGFFEGANKEIDWHNVDEEFNEFAEEQLMSAGVLLFGRVTYDLMASYWPSEPAMANDPFIAERMNTIPKIVFSKTLQKAEWNNTTLVKENIAAGIMQLKQQPGKNMFILGSAVLSATLMQLGLIDEYQVMVNPMLLGKGNPLFKSGNDKLDLRLINTRVFDSGNVLLCYEPG